MEGLKLRCFYCGRENTLETRDNYVIKGEKRIIRIKSDKFNIYWCYKCKRHCIELKEDKNDIQKTIQDSQ